MVTNPKNNSHIFAIVTMSGWDLSKDIVDLYKEPNEKGSDKQEKEKRKGLDKSYDMVQNTNEQIIEKPKVTEEKVESEQAQKGVDGISHIPY